jgi:hypothetical protein
MGMSDIAFITSWCAFIASRAAFEEGKKRTYYDRQMWRRISPVATPACLGMEDKVTVGQR